jgi:hypothetical protein
MDPDAMTTGCASFSKRYELGVKTTVRQVEEVAIAP